MWWLRARPLLKGRRTRFWVDAMFIQNAKQFVTDAVALFGLFLVAQLFFQQPKIVQGHGIFWVQIQRFFVIRDCAVRVPNGLFHPTAGTVAVAVVGLGFGGLVQPCHRVFFLTTMEVAHRTVMHGVGIAVGHVLFGLPPCLPGREGLCPCTVFHGLLSQAFGRGVVSVGIVRSFHAFLHGIAKLHHLGQMQYPVYLQLTGTENVYAVQGPDRFWECTQIGSQVACHDVVAGTWPERQRIMDMVADGGPWERIDAPSFHAKWNLGNCGMSSRGKNIQVKSHVELADHTSFGISAKARWFTEVTSVDELRQALDWARERDLELLVLGGGSNMLFHGDVEALVVQIRIQGMQVISDDGRHVRVAVGAGEVWHDFVMHSLDKGWGGLENLSLIPGSVGASPMQNIGAYGVEIKDHFAWLDAVRLSDGALHRFNKEDCAFGYRESVFKREEKGRWVLVQVAFDLDRKSPLRMGYGAIEQELASIPVAQRTHKNVSEAVIRIRRSKLPDPAEIGNAGSFFKNPTVSREMAEDLAEAHPDMPRYPQPSGKVKLAAGWLIEKAGWKGHSRKTHGVHDKQALVLVHHGGASGKEVWALAQDIMASVQTTFGVTLEPEVNQIGLLD